MRNIFIFICLYTIAFATQEEQASFNIPVINPIKQDISQSKRYYGRVEADESANVSISMRTDGFIEKLFVDKIYTKVKRGDPLFLFYSPELIDAQSEFLTTKNSLSRQKLELLGVDSKEIDKIVKTHKIINELNFYSPIDGVVFAKNVSVGSGVKKGEEVLRITNLDKLWVVANIYQEDIAFFKNANNEAYVSIEGFTEKIPVKLEIIYPQVNDSFIQARFVIENPKGEIFPNMFAYVFIQSPHSLKLTLPKSAVLYKNKKYFVFIEDNGGFSPQEVKAKRIIGKPFYEVIDGLDEHVKVAKDALFILDSDAQNNGDYE